MIIRNPSSFRDRAGFIFTFQNKIYRQVNRVYRDAYRHLMDSGLYEQLTNENLLIRHQEQEQNLTGDPDYFITLEPEPLSFISYPYEWCFSQLKDAALLTLRLMELSMDKGMLLKDATPYNVQFVNGKALWIDSLSFETYNETKPWVAYYQFCETFLYPLLLDHYGILEVHRSFQTYANGIPAENCVKLLPKKCGYNLFNYLHLYLAAKLKNRQKPVTPQKSFTYSKIKMHRLLTHLRDRIAAIKPNRGKTAWNNYYTETILSTDYLNRKKQLLESWSGLLAGQKILDIGCNDGYFSLLLAKNRQLVWATDFDAACVENLYHTIRKNNLTNIQPLCMDLLNPAPAQGFFHSERAGFFERVQPNTILMLAVVHHLVITKNLSFQLLAEKLAPVCTELVIEFVPREDEKVQILLANKEDVFTDYEEKEMEIQFEKFFHIFKKEKIEPTGRVLFFLKHK